MPASRTPRKEDRELAQLQAATTEPDVRLPAEARAEEDDDEIRVPLTSTETGATAKFRLGHEVTFTSMMRWAAAAEDGNGPASLAAYFRVLRNIVHPEDFLGLLAFGDDENCSYEDYKAFQEAAFEALTGNPTE